LVAGGSIPGHDLEALSHGAFEACDGDLHLGGEQMMGEAAQAITDAVGDVIGHRAAGNGSPAGSLDHDDAEESREEEDSAGR
jgi:hypothetical protein